MNGLEQKNYGLSIERWKRIFLFTIIFTVTYFILITSIAPTRYNLKEGDIANADIKAPRETIDVEATKVKEKEEADKVDRQYSFKTEVGIEAKNNITQFFTKLININSNEIKEEEKIIQLKKIEGFTLTDSEYKTILTITKEKATEMQWVLYSALDTVYENNIGEETEDTATITITTDAAKTIANDLLSKSELEPSLQRILIDMAKSQIKPNYFYDKEKTEQLITDVMKAMPKEMIKKNQLVVREGEPISKRQIEILTDLGLLGEENQNSYLPIFLPLGIFVFLVLSLQYLYLKKERSNLLVETRYLLLIGLLNILTLLFARGIVVISPFSIPLACSAIVMTLLLDYKLSVIINTLNMLLVAVIVGFNPQIIIISIISVIIGATSIRKVNGRNEVLYSTVFLAVGVAIVTFTGGLLQSNNLNMVIKEMTFSVFGALISGILAIGLLPFLEMAFKIVTNIKLLELSNPNNLLLKRVLMEAPGTYHHSLMVANLAEIAAEAINANPILARIGAYYHDIGKLKRPIFFGENQIGRENPHDNIDPTLSTHIILSHTKDGLELAEEYKLPKIIQDIIVEHHGTTLVKYFYYTIKNSAENPEDVKEEDFMYGGPTPSSKEAAIVMLADSVEAAVRSINEPSKEKIEEMVDSIIKDKLYSNQLNNSELTFKDIETIKKCFLRMLYGLYHQRIEYPKESNKS